MRIYVEYAIFDNLIINSILLWFVFRTLKHRVTWWRVAICAVVGGVFAVVLPLLSMGLLALVSPRDFSLAMSMLLMVKILVTVVFLLVMGALIKFLAKRGTMRNFLRDVVITFRDKEFRVKGYLDTGNRLVDEGAPVVVISRSLYFDMCEFSRPKGHYINFSTVGGGDKMFVFRPSGFEIGGQGAREVCLGVATRGFGDSIKYDALLNANLA